MTNQALVLGGTGMLGSAIVRRLQKSEVSATATAREISGVSPRVTSFKPFSVNMGGLSALLENYGNGDVIVNCIGLIKHRLDDSKQSDRLDAIRVNAEFPYELAEAAERQGFRVLQIATDCVYSGRSGSYDERAPHDAQDVYGKTKSLGEVPNENFLNLRCSIIGRELSGSTSLVGWLLSQPQGATIRGYLDHRWNGVTTGSFADIVTGLIASGSELSGTFHVVPVDAINKSDLSEMILSTFGRNDVTVIPTITGAAVDRTLTTRHPETNQMLWEAAGLSGPPTIKQMVQTLTS
jgi:dTDP-4-dehydrorhamnose reductase